MASRPHAVALRDQIIAVLRDAEQPLSTPELAATILPWPIVRNVRVDTPARRATPTTANPHAMAGRSTAWRYGHYQRASMHTFAILNAAASSPAAPSSDVDIATRLARVNQERERGNYRPVYWRYVDQEADQAFNAIRAQFEAGSDA